MPSRDVSADFARFGEDLADHYDLLTGDFPGKPVGSAKATETFQQALTMREADRLNMQVEIHSGYAASCMI